MKIKIMHYPCSLEFEITEELPPWDPVDWNSPGWRRRTEIAQQKLRETSFPTSHEPEDFIVERVVAYKNGELWYLGS